MFADEADVAVDAISARSEKFRRLSTWLWKPCRDLENATSQLRDADRLAPLGLCAQELVELRADEEDDRRDVEVRRDHDEHEQVSRRRLVVDDVFEEPGVHRGRHEPGDDDHSGADSRPALAAMLDGSEARDEADRDAEEDRSDRPAQDR